MADLAERPDCVYHYTTAVGFDGILRGEIHATNFSFLNDSSEVQFGQIIVEQCLAAHDSTASALGSSLIAEIREKFKAATVAEVYVACFSGLEDDLSQWRAYGNSQFERFSIAFDFAALCKLAAMHRDVAFVEVLYDEHDQLKRVGDLIDKALRLFESQTRTEPIGDYAAVVSTYLARIVPALKNPVFRVEREWRLILWRDRDDEDFCVQFDASRGVLRPYLSLPFDQPVAIVGLHVLAPTRGERTRKAAEMRLQAGKVAVEALASKIPFAD